MLMSMGSKPLAFKGRTTSTRKHYVQ